MGLFSGDQYELLYWVSLLVTVQCRLLTYHLFVVFPESLRSAQGLPTVIRDSLMTPTYQGSSPMPHCLLPGNLKLKHPQGEIRE